MLLGVDVIAPWAQVGLTGDMDRAGSDQLRSVAADLLGAQAVTDLTVELSSVTYLGASGLAALVAVDRLVEEVGGRLTIVGATPRTRRVITLGGLERAFLPAPSPLPAAATDPYEDDDLSRQLYVLGRLLLSESAVTEDLRRVVRNAVGSVSGCTAATVALLAEGDSRLTAVSDRVAIEVDVAQYIAGEGPCLEATRTAERIRVDLLGPAEQFPHFAPLALRAGVGSVLSVPVVLGGDTVGTLDLYSDRALGPAAELPAEICATQAATAIARSNTYATARRLAQSAQRRLNVISDTSIAEGILAALHECTIQEAQHLLRAAAVANVETVVEAARRIIRGVVHPQ